MKKVLLGTVLGGGILFAASSWATCVLCPAEMPTSSVVTTYTTDVGRSITGIVTSIINLCGEGEAKAQLIAKQEEDNSNAGSGGGGSDGSSIAPEESSDSDSEDDTTVAASEFTGSAFTYIKTHVLDKQGNVGYTPLKTALASASDLSTLRQNLRTIIEEKFFANTAIEEQRTVDYKTGIEANRQEYILEATRRHVTTSNTVKNKIQNDLAVIGSAALTSSNELGSIAIDAYTLEQTVKMELVDLALQIEMMEADAIQFLTHQPVDLLTETKPSDS